MGCEVSIKVRPILGDGIVGEGSGGVVCSGIGGMGVIFNTLGATEGDRGFRVFFLSGILCERGRGSVGDVGGGSVGLGVAVWKISASLCGWTAFFSHSGGTAGFFPNISTKTNVLAPVFVRCSSLLK